MIEKRFGEKKFSYGGMYMRTMFGYTEVIRNRTSAGKGFKNEGVIL